MLLQQVQSPKLVTVLSTPSLLWHVQGEPPPSGKSGWLLIVHASEDTSAAMLREAFVIDVVPELVPHSFVQSSVTAGGLHPLDVCVCCVCRPRRVSSTTGSPLSS